MNKWADYLISEVNYDSKHLISVAIRHQDTDKGITLGIPVDRLTISSDIKNGLSYTTIYHGNNSWKKGKVIQTFFIDGTPYLRIDGNKVILDYLGDLPNSSIVIEEPTQELESPPEPVVETPSSSKGSLPKGFTAKPTQELESPPEPVVETPSSSKGSLPKGFTAKPTQELESPPEPVVETPSSSKGSLPKGFTAKPTQELESPPEPVVETPSSSKGSLPKGTTQAPPTQTSSTYAEQKSRKQELDDYENDYMQRIEQQRIDDEKVYQELVASEAIARDQQVRGSLPKGFESPPEPVVETPSSSKGSLPKGFTAKPTQELESPPEPVVEIQEKEVTPEQLSQVNDLEQQIDELEDMLATQNLPEPEEVTPEQLSQVNDLEQQIDELEDILFSQLDPTSEGTPEQLSKIKKLEKEIAKLETVDLEHEIIQTLQNQNKKLDNIEKKLHKSPSKKSPSKKSPSKKSPSKKSPSKKSPSDFLEAYCVKCKTKRKIKNPKATIMKNGRDAIKGSCSICNCNVFRIGKMKK